MIRISSLIFVFLWFISGVGFGISLGNEGVGNDLIQSAKQLVTENHVLIKPLVKQAQPNNNLLVHSSHCNDLTTDNKRIDCVKEDLNKNIQRLLDVIGAKS